MARILVVDDESLVRRAMTRILTSEGYSVVTAGGGEEALRYAADTIFDLAVVDYDMPGRDGLWVLSSLRELMPGCIRVLMTGRTDFPIVVEAVNRGEVLRVIQKPFEPTRIRNLVAEAFGAVERMHAVREAQQRAVQHSEKSMLEQGLASEHFQLAIQPIVRAGTGEIFGYESLLRSTHPVLDGPLSILKVAERSKMLNELGHLVACRAADLLTRIPHHVKLFVNLHPDQLADPRLLDHTLRPLMPHAKRCCLEITERSKLSDISDWEDAVESMQDAGFDIAVDDLGAGYNALSILADLQPSFIKIDMSIVRNVDTEPRKQRLVDLLCKFGDATDALVIAEGVETQGESETLVECGSHLFQGYYFGRPSLDIDAAVSAAS
jgi:EAL domain-containing protein (putative c-di-GMP-specific phosphodiesterase class I)/AmiR/NasT family two-component response regulator